MSKRQREAQERARQVRLRQRQAQARRRRLIIAGSAVALVLVAVSAMVVVKLTASGNPSPPPAASGGTAAAVMAAVTGMPPDVLDRVGQGRVTTLPSVLKGQPMLTADGKPLILYVGADYCPFCAAQRWPMVVALSRFGTFAGLRLTTSAADDIYPSTATLSFFGSSYRSDYLSFQGVETSGNVRQGRAYAPLQALTESQRQLMATFNAPPYVPADAAGSIPFVDFANQALSVGASYSPQLLAGRSADQIAASLADPADGTSQAVLGTANALTALLCRLTGDQPAATCTTPAVRAYAGRFDDAAR